MSRLFVLGLVLFGRCALGQVASVTFQTVLPANTPLSDTIYLAGNFQNWDPGATPMTRDDATHAHVTITTTQGNALEFKFTRGDWSRGEKAADCGEIANRTATANNGATVNSTVANWADNCVAFYDARAEKITLNSSTLGVTKSFYLYTPPGYSLTTGQRYPTLYLFRGHESEWINKNQDGQRGGKNVIDVYESLLASGQVGPMILVFPGISSDDNSVPGMLTNFKSPQLATAAGVGTGRFEDYLVQEIIPYVDTKYRTAASKNGRGVDGFSLGGFMSAKIAAQHPELFKSAGVFDGTHFYSRVSCSAVDLADQTFLNSMFDPVFGNPRDTAFAALNNGPSLICNSTPALLQSLHWFVQYGPVTAEPNDANYLRGEHLLQKLTAQGVTNEITAVLSGGHNWGTADEHMRQTLPLHWNTLGSAGVFPLQIDSLTKTGNGHAIAKGHGRPFTQYAVQMTDSLSQAFTTIATVTASASGELSYEDAKSSDAPARFYRFALP